MIVTMDRPRATDILISVVDCDVLEVRESDHCSEQLTFVRKLKQISLILQVHCIGLTQTRFEFSRQHLVWTQNALRSEIWRMVPKMEDANR
jgi:hypothetical protein